MHVMVTGTGFIGSYVVKNLLEQGHEVIFYGFFENPTAIRDVVGHGVFTEVKGDVLDYDLLEKTMKENSVESVVHTAAVLIAGARENPLNAVKVNVLGTANVLEAARKTDVEKIVYTSSGQVYAMLNPYVEVPKPDSGVVKEEESILPGSVYATTKAASEYLGLNYSNIYGIDFIALRLPTVYGGWLGQMGRAGVLKTMCEKALRGEDLTVDEYKSEWGYVKDMARACVLAVSKRKPKYRIMNVGSGKINSLREAVDILKGELGDNRVKINVKEVQQPERLPSDLSKAREELGYEPEYDFEKGVRDLLDWAKKHYG
ncbi:MAG TPA: NAD(P)-dependent oxidoreductase [Candidatus Caldiarchaeum subterraneum]|uniref:NAD(P)-dependent oxidoreductase n=1 Tax=Caldiarchaeum subterraneum TaxID=311458 RepID=A0A832ZWW9_CALS0|nr:NAD(P)-dependent oxidoreductase [Candidatus Caldarchaeum subterraneum]